VLLGDADGLGARAEDVGRRGGLDRCSDVQVRRRRKVNRGGQIKPQVNVRVDIQQRENFLVRERDRILGLDLIHRYVALADLIVH